MPQACADNAGDELSRRRDTASTADVTPKIIFPGGRAHRSSHRACRSSSVTSGLLRALHFHGARRHVAHISIRLPGQLVCTRQVQGDVACFCLPRPAASCPGSHGALRLRRPPRRCPAHGKDRSNPPLVSARKVEEDAFTNFSLHPLPLGFTCTGWTADACGAIDDGRGGVLARTPARLRRAGRRPPAPTPRSVLLSLCWFYLGECTV
jgi:hypothetical protein